jgi:hypothetical protein
MSEREDADDVAVPKFNIAEEAVEGVGRAGADAVGDEPDAADSAASPESRPLSSEGMGSHAGRGADADWSPHQARADEGPGAGGGDTRGWDAERRRGPVTDPRESSGAGRPGDADSGEPVGVSEDSPLGEGSDDSAVPDLDPAEPRLSGR